MSENLTSTLSIAEWAEIKRITAEIMSGMDCFNPSKFEAHVRGVLARNIMAANATYAAQLAEEKIHRPASRAIVEHNIATCSLAYCGRYPGQRRDSRPEATS